MEIPTIDPAEFQQRSEDISDLLENIKDGSNIAKPNAPTFHWLTLAFAAWATIATLFAAYLYIQA